MTRNQISSLIFSFFVFFIVACKMDSKSLFGGNGTGAVTESANPPPETSPKPPSPPVEKKAPVETQECLYATLQVTNKDDEKCLAPGGPSNWLAKAYFGKDVPGGDAADGPAMRLVFKFLRDGSKPLLHPDPMFMRSKRNINGVMDCKPISTEFAWQAAIYDCYWRGAGAQGQEYLPLIVSVNNSSCGASTNLTVAYDDGPGCNFRLPPVGYPKVYLGHGIIMQPLVKK